jgi:hypothetical protein
MRNSEQLQQVRAIASVLQYSHQSTECNLLSIDLSPITTHYAIAIAQTYLWRCRSPTFHRKITSRPAMLTPRRLRSTTPQEVKYSFMYCLLCIASRRVCMFVSPRVALRRYFALICGSFCRFESHLITLHRITSLCVALRSLCGRFASLCDCVVIALWSLCVVLRLPCNRFAVAL